MVNDTISDMLTRIRNANLAYKTNVSVSKTQIHEKICEILNEKALLTNFMFLKLNPNELIIHLKYLRNLVPKEVVGLGKPCITNLKRISKPGLRIYTNHKEIPTNSWWYGNYYSFDF